MLLFKLVIFVHILAATIWVGGHLVLCLCFLPKALKKDDFSIISQFEQAYEKIGFPSLIVLVLTGLYMAHTYAPTFFDFDFQNHYTRHIFFKLVLLFITLGLALNARLNVIPKKKLHTLSWHIVSVTLLGILFVLVGFSARSGGIL